MGRQDTGKGVSGNTGSPACSRAEEMHPQAPKLGTHSYGQFGEIAEVGSSAALVTVGILQWAGCCSPNLRRMHASNLLLPKHLEEKNVKCLFIVRVTCYSLLMQRNLGAGPVSA